MLCARTSRLCRGLSQILSACTNAAIDLAMYGRETRRAVILSSATTLTGSRQALLEASRRHRGCLLRPRRHWIRSRLPRPHQPTRASTTARAFCIALHTADVDTPTWPPLPTSSTSLSAHVAMSGSTQVTSSEQFSTLLASSRLVVVHCKLHGPLSPRCNTYSLLPAQSITSGTSPVRPSVPSTTSSHRPSPVRAPSPSPKSTPSSRRRLRRVTAPPSELALYQAVSVTTY